jgi:Mg2+ and Co2+ transporter CorA
VSDALLFREHEVEEVDGWPGLLDRLGPSSLLWIDLEHPDDEEFACLAKALGLDDHSVRRLEGEETSPYLCDFGEYIHVTGCVPRGESRVLEGVDCLVSKSWVVTVRDGPVEVVDELREQAEGAGEVGRLDGLGFVADILTWVLEGYLRAFETIDEELERLDRDAMQGSPSHERSLARLVEVRAEIGHLRRTLVSHRTVLLALTRPELAGISTADSGERFHCCSAGSARSPRPRATAESPWSRPSTC